MAFFDKKTCDICGGKIGLLGQRKLDDGKMCKDCTKKLSPFFSERRRSTVAQIEDQLAYREANQQAVRDFNVTRTLGLGTTLLLDEDQRKFMVSSSRNWQQENPDVLDFSQVTGCVIDIDERRDELKTRDKDGNEVSYRPPRYEHSYDFYINIHVNSPWFDVIRFRINRSSITVEAPPGRLMIQGGAEIGRMSIDYRECEALGEEMKQALTAVRESVREEVAAASAPKTAKICPYCGATTIPDANNRCEFCEGPL